MLAVSAQQHHHAFVDHHSTPSLPRLSSSQPRAHSQGGSQGPDAIPGALPSSLGPSMERSASEYSQSGLPSPYPSSKSHPTNPRNPGANGDIESEASSVSVDHTSAAHYATPPPQQQQQQQAPPQQQQQQQPPDVRSGLGSNYSTSATPTSDYSVFPASARSGSFPEHIQRSYHPASNHSGSSGDPSIAAPSPTYTTHSQYSPYAPPSQDMSHGYAHPGGGIYAQPRPDWTGYGQQHATPLTPGHHVFPQAPNSAPPHRPNQVYSFVPIPGAQQHKRPRRRYEEIERMYKCGWNGCEKAYGTLNHLNAHVTMQSHGQKRTPEEFKEIRKEWKLRKKEEESARKADEERQRQAAAAASQNGSGDGQAGAETAQPASGYAGSRGAVQLPPIGYQTPNQYQAPGSAGIHQPLPEYGTNYLHTNYQPASPYGQSQAGQQLYNQQGGGLPNQ